jgi:hypothetical protein
VSNQLQLTNISNIKLRAPKIDKNKKIYYDYLKPGSDTEITTEIGRHS